jgi:hypothetical protein
VQSEIAFDESRHEVAAVQRHEKPGIRELDEKEVLSAFQVTVAAATWWAM